MNEISKEKLIIVFKKMKAPVGKEVDSILIPIDPAETYKNFFETNNQIETLLINLDTKATFEMKAMENGIRIWRVK